MQSDAVTVPTYGVCALGERQSGISVNLSIARRLIVKGAEFKVSGMCVGVRWFRLFALARNHLSFDNLSIHHVWGVV